MIIERIWKKILNVDQESDFFMNVKCSEQRSLDSGSVEECRNGKRGKLSVSHHTYFLSMHSTCCNLYIYLHRIRYQRKAQWNKLFPTIDVTLERNLYTMKYLQISFRVLMAFREDLMGFKAPRRTECVLRGTEAYLEKLTARESCIYKQSLN